MMKNDLTTKEITKMEHCIGFELRKVYYRHGKYYFKPYRNHFMPGGDDCQIWEGLEEKGYAESSDSMGHKHYWLTTKGLDALSQLHKVYIYSDSSTGNAVDASSDVLRVLIENDVYCGYGCWKPSSSKNIAMDTRLPQNLAKEALCYLKERGYVKVDHDGGANDDGTLWCTHGWVLTDKWKNENKDIYKKYWDEECKKIDKGNALL